MAEYFVLTPTHPSAAGIRTPEALRAQLAQRRAGSRTLEGVRTQLAAEFRAEVEEGLRGSDENAGAVARPERRKDPAEQQRRPLVPAGQLQAAAATKSARRTLCRSASAGCAGAGPPPAPVSAGEGGAAESDDAASQCSSYRELSVTSVGSRTSQGSRLSQLSRRSGASLRRQPSSKELEQAEIEAKRCEVKAQMARNRQTLRRSLSGLDAGLGAGRTNRSTALTTPREFNITPQRRRSVSRDASDSEAEGPARRTRAWRPELTIPVAPRLGPEARRTEERAAKAREAAAEAPGRGSPRRAEPPGGAAGTPSRTAEERAELARRAAWRARDEAGDRERAKVCVFRRPSEAETCGAAPRPLPAAPKPSRPATPQRARPSFGSSASRPCLG